MDNDNKYFIYDYRPRKLYCMIEDCIGFWLRGHEFIEDDMVLYWAKDK